MTIGILAHVDAGKTTTTEQLLYAAGQIKRAGSIKAGNTQTDWLELERRRGISINAAATQLLYRDVQINIIDTPGHTDFVGEVERALSVLDGVVLIVSASEGVQPQTRLFWQALRALRLPALFFVNKIDRAGCEPLRVLSELQQLSPYAVPLQAITGQGDKGCAVRAAELGEDALLALSDLDEALAARVLNDEAIDAAEIARCLRAQCARGEAYPVLFGAAQLGVGTRELLDALIDYLPPATGENDAPVSGTVFKLQHTEGGKFAHVRLFQGSLSKRDAVRVSGAGREPVMEKVTLIKRAVGARLEDMERLEAGDIAALGGLSSARVGDILGEAPPRTPLRLATPLFSVQVLGDAAKLSERLAAAQLLAEEDPLLETSWSPEERELVVRIMGAVQLEVLAERFRERFSLDVTFGKPSVIYRSTPSRRGVGFEAYTMPKPCWAVVELMVEPLPRGSGVVFVSAVEDRAILPRYQHHVETSVYETLKQGRLGWEVTDLRVTLIGGEHHLIHTHPMDFFLATPIALMRALEAAGETLLEPLLRVEIEAAEAFANRLIGEILAMRGEFDSPVMQGGIVHIGAMIPVATSLDFPVWLASLTGGKGTLHSVFGGYRECPRELGATTRLRGVDPLDRMKWILYKRNALG